MTDSKFENVKKEIRSLLISYQKGVSLSEFQKEYRSFIGRKIPFEEFNFKDEVSFLKAMPDVVAMYPAPVRGDFHLYGIADESVQHIQSMVCKQKPSKHRTSYRAPRTAPASSSYVRSRIKAYEMPPRFSKKEIPEGVDKHVIQMLDYYPNGLKLTHFLSTFSNYYKRRFVFKDWGFYTLEDCLETIPGVIARSKNNEIIVLLSKFDAKKRASPKALLPTPKAKDSYPLKKSFNDGNTVPKNSQLDYFDRNFSKSESSQKTETKITSSTNTHSNKFLLETPSGKIDTKATSSTITHTNKCLLDTPSEIIAGSKPDLPTGKTYLLDRFVEDSYQNQNSQNNASAEKKNSFENPTATPNEQKAVSNSKLKVGALDDRKLIDFEDDIQPNNDISKDLKFQEFNYINKDMDVLDSFSPAIYKDTTVIISENIKRNLEKVIGNYPHGIYAVDFKNNYEKVTKTEFDLHSLGFNYLADLIDAVPDILIRKPITGSKKDWVIYPANTSEDINGNDAILGKCSVLFIECVILNTRKILQAYSEGVKLKEFTDMYSFNCNEPLYIRDLGFDNMEFFLLSIAKRVPLKIVPQDGYKVVLLDKFEETKQETIPPIKPPVPPLQLTDVAKPEAEFKDFKFPKNFDYSKYFPMYTSSIANPGLLYIQLQGDDTSGALKTLYDEMESFYKSECGNVYEMKPKDIKVNTACIALWPEDKHWYRAKITCIKSMDFVQVFYVDYGTTDEIPTSMLRYIKEEYLSLPAQAIKARLAFLRPPSKATSWDKKSRKRMLELCQDISLMAKIECMMNNVPSLILCDTNGNEDLFINDILTSEGIAEVCDETEVPELAPSPVLENQAFQQFVNCLASAVQTSPDAITRMVQNLSKNLAQTSVSPGFASQPVAPLVPFIPAPYVAPSSYNPSAYFHTSPPTFFNYPIQQPFYHNYPPGFVQDSSQNAALGAVKDIPTNEIPPAENYPEETSSPDGSEIFGEDDDEYFEQMYQKLTSNNNVKQCYVKRLKTTDNYIFHILLFNSKPFVASGDISNLIWNSQDPSQLFFRLQSQEVELPSITLYEQGHEEFFQQLKRFYVKGMHVSSDNKASILMYPLTNINQILNLFGHPSAALRVKVDTELSTFNPSSVHWQESPDTEMPGEIEEVKSVTDDDKLNRLCLYDLKTMKEGIRSKRLMLMKKQNPDYEEEILKLNQLFTKVRERIVEIEQICKMFSDKK